jgi:nucleotidyltransferase substrate binding protein (TIGR01987 family)
MNAKAIDLSSSIKALAQLQEALRFWQAEAMDTALKPHLRSAVIRSFEFTYELAIRMLRRVLIERSEAADLIADLSFNDLLRKGADAGLVSEPEMWRQWREMRNSTSHTYNEAMAAKVAAGVEGFAAGAAQLLAALEKNIGR